MFISVLTFMAFFAASAAAAATGSLFSPGQWYDRLEKPRWTPPNWLFPVVWTILYISMTIAAWRVAFTDSPLVPLALALWALQIALNALWTPVFFGLQRLWGGLIVLVMLWAAVVLTTIAFFFVDAVAGWLFVPYVLWVSTAGALNYEVWKRNPAAVPAGTH